MENLSVNTEGHRATQVQELKLKTTSLSAGGGSAVSKYVSQLGQNITNLDNPVPHRDMGSEQKETIYNLLLTN